MVTSEEIKKAIEKHKQELPRYQKLYNYYIGKHDILNRVLADPDRPNNKIVTDYPGMIIGAVLGYFASKPITYISKSGNEKFLEDLQQIFFINDEEDENAEIVKDFSIFGKCYELLWVDPEGKIRFSEYSPLEMYVEKDSKDNIKFAIRYWEEDQNGKKITKVEVYDRNGIYYFVSNDGDNFIPDPNEKSKPHYFGETPVIIYRNNDEEIGDYEKFIPLIDGIDKLLSDSANELEYWTNAYLVLVGYDATTYEDIKKLKQDGVLLLREKGEADFLIKDVNNQFQQNFFETVNKLIHMQSATPELTSEKFASNLSGVAIGYKLFDLETKCSIKERKMTKALRKRIKLICEILNKKGKNYDYTDIRFQFSRNVPQNEAEITDMITKLVNLVDQETLLSWHPRIQDAAVTVRKVKEQNDSIDLDRVFNDEDDPGEE